jgi:hypothetical protein
MAWCDACRFPPFPSGLDSSFVPIFARWITAFAPNIDVLNTAAVTVGSSKAEDSIILASVIKNVRGIKGLAVIKISKINGKRAAPVVRCQGWIVRLPRRTRRENLKKSNNNVINTSFKEKDATGLDKLASDVHVSPMTDEKSLCSQMLKLKVVSSVNSALWSWKDCSLILAPQRSKGR